MSYYRAKLNAAAKAITDSNDREREIAARRSVARTEHWRDWLQQYRAQPRPTNFDWRPSLPAVKPIVTPITPPGVPNGKEIIEGEFTVVADADASSHRRAEGGQAESGSDAAGAGGEAAPRWQAEEDTPF
jgi:hypothetical protein